MGATKTDWGESTWNSTHNSLHGIPELNGGIGRHSPQAMGASYAPPLHPTLAAVAHATGRMMLPRVNDRQRRMWPDVAHATVQSSEIGLSVDAADPRDGVSRKLARRGKLNRMSDSLPSEYRGSTLYTCN